MSEKPRRRNDGPAAIELIEETVHLLRGVPAGTLALYYAGTAPFALGAVFFAAHATWFHPSEAVIAWNALGLVALFALMKAAQAEFCARLLAQRLGDAPPKTSWRHWARLARVQLAVQAWGLLTLPIALAIGVPFPWLYAYFQNASVIGDGRGLTAESRTQAARWPAQNVLGQLLLSAFAIAVWANVAAAFWLVPWLANRLLGLDNLFGFGGWWIANTTFWTATGMLTWLACDPLVKAFFTLRIFYGRSRTTGEDLSVELRRSGRGRKRAATAAVLALAMLVALPRMGNLRGAETPAARAVDARELDAAIERVLARSEFQWRLPPLPEKVSAAGDEGRVARFFRIGGEWMRDFFKWILRLARNAVRWIRGLFPDFSGGAGAAATTGQTLAATLYVLMWVFAVLVAGLLLAAMVIAWRRRKLFRPPVAIAAHAVSVAVPDLSDESTQAAQLPTDGWLALAREQIALGEWRLAWRALHLATLARLGADGLVALAKFKTNLDYERELRRRAAARQEIVAWFGARRRAFEAVWYGREAAGEGVAREWLAELERPSLT